MTYISGFLSPVPTANKDAYHDHAAKAAPYFKSLGALEVVEAWGADVPDGEHTSFPMATKLKEDETVVLGWMIWPDKATADAAFEKMMSDEEFHNSMGEMPFDGKRMMWGGFEQLLKE
ncbi:DUF1428 domain-containing protein [Paracoccaceae bacterium GXU_MW_L88]